MEIKRILACLLPVCLLTGCGTKNSGSTRANISASVSENTGTENPVETEEADVLNDPDVNEVMVRQGLIGTDYICAAAFIGYYEGRYDGLSEFLTSTGYAENYPFMTGIPWERFVEFDGGELYCILPRSSEASIKVYEWIMDEENGYAGGTGQLLYESETGDPIFIRGNISDIMPNIHIEITDGDEFLEYEPMLSLYDGSLTVPGIAPFVADITDYSLIQNGTE